MLKILTKPLELKIDGKLITFKSMDDFEFAMRPRTMLPQNRITETINLSSGELALESNAMDVAMEQITELINESSGSGEVTQKLKKIKSVIFSNDNDWRDIFYTLKKDRSTDSSKYKLVALTAYLQYLNNRQELVKTVKARLEQNETPQDNTEIAEFKTGELDIDDSFDSNILAKQLGMNDMPIAEYVELELEQGTEIKLLLADNQCKLVLKNGIKFIDSENIEYPIVIGLNKIGRGRECNVRFVETMPRISRLHLIIINHDNKKLELTDLSTYGTYYLKQST
jgi:FHA domain-containing protein